MLLNQWLVLLQTKQWVNQRKRAIHNYIDGTLLPDFKSEMKKINSQVISSINVILHEEQRNHKPKENCLGTNAKRVY